MAGNVPPAVESRGAKGKRSLLLQPLASRAVPEQLIEVANYIPSPPPSPEGASDDAAAISVSVTQS